MCISILNPVAVSSVSNMCAEEEYRLTGTLCHKSIEYVLDETAKVQKYRDSLYTIEAKIEEAQAQLPQEDMLSEPLTQLKKLLGTVRGDNKVALASVIEKLEEIASETIRATEYGNSELNDALRQIPKFEY